MTAQTTPTPLERVASAHPVPLRRIAWVTWRQHRIALLVMVVLIAGLALYVWIAGLQMHQAYATAMACHPLSSPACGNLFLNANQMNPILASGYVLQAVPALIGMFIGAPALAREMESGTFRFAWTQGFGRLRWALAKLVLLAVVVTAATAALSVLLSWYYQPYFAPRALAVSFSEESPLNPGLFPLLGLTLAAWALAAFMIGAVAGIFIRRVVPAIAATLAAYAVLAVATGAFFRLNYLAPLVTSKLNAPVAAWTTSQWLTKDGVRSPAHGAQAIQLFQQLCPSPPLSQEPVQCFVQHGYTQWTSYQPESWFWPFQLIEAGWLLTLSALLLGIALWHVRRGAG
jgi:ABC-type transport system involved in multi-copper enzyme maturation permease subunit